MKRDALTVSTRRLERNRPGCCTVALLQKLFSDDFLSDEIKRRRREMFIVTECTSFTVKGRGSLRFTINIPPLRGSSDALPQVATRKGLLQQSALEPLLEGGGTWPLSGW